MNNKRDALLLGLALVFFGLAIYFTFKEQEGIGLLLAFAGYAAMKRIS